MRDSILMAKMQQDAKRDGAMLAQLLFLRTRQEAFERAWATSTLWQRLRWVFVPGHMVAVADVIQQGLLERMQQESAKPSIKVVQHV